MFKIREGNMSDLLPVPIASGAIAGINVEGLLEKAVDAKAAVEVLERLMVMRRELQAEAARSAFDRSLAAFQAECPVIVKSQVVHQKNSTAVRYRFAPLDVIVSQVKGLLEKHGLSHTETAIVDKDWVTAVCTVKHCLGHSEKSEFKVPIDPEAYMNAAQKFASALTFAKRYAFCNALGILTGDSDDDSITSGEEPPKMPQDKKEGIKVGGKSQNEPQPVAAASTKPTIEPATPESRTKLIESLADFAQPALEYFQKVGYLLPTESLADLPLRFVPVTKKQFEALKVAIVSFTEGAEAKPAFPPNGESEPKLAKPVEVARAAEPATPPETVEAWRSFPMPFGKQAGVVLGELEKKYLFGLWANFKVETEYNGRAKKPETITKDTKFREMLDDAGRYHGFTKKD